MKETKEDYLFNAIDQSRMIVFRKGNYIRHIPKHPYIEGTEGLSSIEEAVLNPSIITAYTRVDTRTGAQSKCQGYYKITKKKSLGKDKYMIDYWQVCVIYNVRFRRWEIATVLLEMDSPEYVMINTRIEKILYDYR
ncbi:MAG TPA: hypothetical protein VIJ29_00465 [Candidatus Paceibacterota bacterium]